MEANPTSFFSSSVLLFHYLLPASSHKPAACSWNVPAKRLPRNISPADGITLKKRNLAANPAEA
jgi:hypothetical protein